MKMPEECRVIQVTNVAPTATKDQMKTLFGFIGRIDEIVLYPELEPPSTSRICFVKYEYAEDVGVSLHLSNTVFIDRALVVAPVPDGKIPDEKTALAVLTNPAGVTAGSASDEIRRTIYVSNLNPSVTPEQLLQLFGTQAGEVKYIRMAGDEGFGSRAAFIEFTALPSVTRALSLTGQTVGGCLIRVSPANTAIAKPASTGVVGATSKELEQAMKKVDEAQPLISAVLDSDRRSRSRSRSRRSRSRRSRSKHRSRSRSRKRSRSRSRRSRRRSQSKSRRRSRSPKRRKSRSRSPRRRSRSKSRDRRRRSKSRSPKSSKSVRSRSQEKKKTDTKSRDNTPASSNKDTSKRDTDDKKTSKDSEKERKQSSRHRSRSPKTSRRSRSRSNSPSHSGRKGRDDRRRSPERSRERSSRNRNTKDDAKEPEHQSTRGHDGHNGESEHDPSYGSERESKSFASNRQRDADRESDDGYEPKFARNDDNASEADGSHTDGDD